MIPICILAIEDDDDRAFMAELYLNYRRLMYKEILRIVHNQWEAEDVFQTAIEKLIGKVKELRQKDRDHLVSYLIVTSRHVALNALRNGKKFEGYSYDDLCDHPDPAHDRRAIEEGMIHEHELKVLAKIWADLDARTRYILESRYILEKSDAEIAEELQISPQSVRMSLTRARRAARKMMEEAEKTGGHV